MAKNWWEKDEEEEEDDGLSYLRKLRQKAEGKGGTTDYLNQKKAEVKATGRTTLSDGTVYYGDKARQYDAQQNKEIADIVRDMGYYLTERKEYENPAPTRQRETMPDANAPYRMTPEIEAEYQRRNSGPNKLTPYQVYMNAQVSASAEPEPQTWKRPTGPEAPTQKLTPDVEAEYQRRASGQGPSNTLNPYTQYRTTYETRRQNEAKRARDNAESGWPYALETLKGGAQAFEAMMQNPLATLDKLDYWIMRKLGAKTYAGHDINSQKAYDAAHAIDTDIQKSVSAAKAGKGKWASSIIDAFGAAGNIFGTSMMGYGLTGMGAATNALNTVAGKLSAATAGPGAGLGERAVAGASRLAGNVLGDIAANPTNLFISAQSGIGTFDTAKSYGADDRTAAIAGMAAAMTEYFSNKMFSGTPLEDNPNEKGYVVELLEDITDGLAKTGNAGARFQKFAGQFFSNSVVNFVFDKSGEGMEEVITGVLDPWIARLTYNKEEDLATFETLFDDYIGGVLMSLLVGAPQAAVNATRGAVDLVTQGAGNSRGAGWMGNTFNAYTQRLMQNPDWAEKSRGSAEIAEKAESSDSESLRRYAGIYNRTNDVLAMLNGEEPASVGETAFVNSMEAQNYFYIWDTQGARAADAYYVQNVYAAARNRQAQAEERYQQQQVEKRAREAARQQAEQEAIARQAQAEETLAAQEAPKQPPVPQNRAETPETQQATERTSQLPVQNQQETAQERTTPPLPRQMAQEQQERVTTPPVPQNTQEAAQEPTLRIRAQEEQAPQQQEALRIRENEVTEPTRQAPLTIRGANATVEENRQEESYGQGQQTETAAAAGEGDFRSRAETAAEGARRSYLDRIERSSGLGRVLQDLRNYRVVRGAESRASEVSRIRNQAEAGNQRDVSALDYGISNGSAEQSAKELDNATASRVLGRNWDRAVSELARQGVTLKAMTGQLKKEDGTQVRAFFSGDGKTIVVQADHPKLSWNQLLDHEDLHRRIKENPAYRKAVEDALLADRQLQAYLPEIIDRYAQAYSRLAPGLSADDVIEELLADYRAGFDMLDPLGMNPITARAAKRAAKDIKSAEKTLRKQVDEQRPVSVDDEARASREFDSDYMQAAAAYNQTSKHVPDSLMNDVAKVRETIKAKLEEIQDEARLPADVTGNTFFKNGSYNGSEENTTVCPRSLSVDALADAVGDALGRPLTIEETVYVAQQAFHFTDVPQCLYCYVAMDRMAKRQLLGEYVNKRTQVITDLENGMSREEALAAYKKRETTGNKQWSNDKQKRFDLWYNAFESGTPMLRMSNLSSEDAVAKALADSGLKAETEDALQYAQKASWAKKRVGFTAYNNHILKWDQKRINALNSMFGLRMYSFSDFSPAFILENMQMVTDAAVRGLKMLAYTKELDFVRIFAGTGMNINVSTFGMDGGDGKVHMDAMQGADWKEAQDLRKKYPNVGVTFVATNDNQVNWALDQDWIDVVIPFHMVKTGATVADILGYQNYTAETSDKKIAGEKAKQKEIFPNQHQNNKEKYLAALEKANLTPRFERWLDHPNYMKLVNETRRSAGDTPAVQPKFDQEAVNAALKSLDDMVKRGGYGVPIGGSLENLADIAAEMSDDIRKGIAQDLREHNRQKGKAESQQEGKASTEIDTEYMAAAESGDMETAQRMVDEAAKKAGYTIKKYHQTNVPNIHVFDIGIGTHGGTDSETPYGIFTKNTRADIGLGDIQMSLYLKPGKTFVINSRDELRSRMPDAYNLLSTKLEAIDAKYNALVEEAEDALFDAQDAYEEKHPEAEVTLEDIVNNRTYDDPACQRANEHWKAVMAEWSEEADKIRVQAKEELSKYLRDSGYDSMEIKLDKGTNGRSTDTFIVFSPEQVKSAAPVTYDDNGNVIPLSERFNPEKEDIRYSIEIDPEVAAQFSPEAIARRQSNRTKGVKGERKVSRVRSNTYEYSGLYNEVEAQMDEADEENYTYDPVSEKKSMNEALGRLKADFDGEVSRLSEADRQWGGSDLDTAMGILHRYRTEGRATGDYGDFWRWSKVIQEKGTKGGQFIQAFAKYTRTGTGAAMKGAKDIHDRFKLNPAQQKQVDAAKKKLMDGIDGDMDGAAQDAMKQAKGKKEPTKKQDGKVDKKKLDAEVQRRKDAERLVREISKLFEKQQNHGEPVENWLNLTGEELARKIAGRFSEPKQRTKTTMQTILSDLVGFAEEHALPDRKKAEGTKRTAIDIITDYLNNRDAYGTAWAAAQSYLRAAYTDDQEKLDALNSFLTATIAYNAEGTDRTMLDAILQSADVLGISEKRILELTSAGATASTIDRIGDELVSQVKERMGADYDESFTQQLKDAVRRHITGISLQESAEEQRLRLGGMTTDAARQLEMNLQKLLTQSRGDKNKAAQSVADYLIRELGIPSSDAAIAAERITGAFMDEMASRADRRLQQMFAEKKPRTQEQRDRLLDLIRLGGLTNSNVEDAVVDALGLGGMSRERQRELVGIMAQFGETLDAMEADDLDGLKDLIRAQAAVRNTPLSRQAEKTLAGETDAQYLREFALAQLDAIAGDFAEMSPGAKISTFQTISHLLNMRTALRNLTSNQVFDLVDSAANNLATIPDMVIGAFTGKRTVGTNKSWLSEMKRAGAKQGAARNALEVRLDVSPDDRQKSKYGTAGRRTNSMAASNAFGRILSHLEEVMGYELNTTDEFHKGSVRGETLESLARFVERGDITQEQANAWAEEEALYRSFQDDTLVGNIMGELKTLLNVIGFGDSGKTNSRGRTIHDFGLGDLVVKYTQVPGALIHRGIEYSPLGYAKMLYDLAIAKDSLVRTQRRGEDVTNAQRKLALDIGRATTGSGLITLFAVLAKAGLLRRDDDDKDKNAKAMHAAQGLSGTQLNVTALGRWISGEDAEPKDGDVLADIGFLEPLDSLMTIATLLAKDKDLSVSDVGVKSLDGVWKAISNTSAMQTISNIISTVQYHDEENDLPLYFQIPIEIASDSVSGFIPSPVRQLAQATDTTYRDQYRSKALNDQIQAKVMNSIPGVRQMLAPKITPLGEDRKYQKPLLNYLNATLNPGNINVYQASGVVDELNRVYAVTEDEKIWPERNAPYSFKAKTKPMNDPNAKYEDGAFTLTPDERTQYQRTRGQQTNAIMEDVMGTDWYKAMDPTTQADVLNWIGNFSNYIAKKEMLAGRELDYGSDTYDKYYASLMKGTSPADVVAAAKKKVAEPAKELAAAEVVIAVAKIPEASKEEAETMSADAKRYYAGFLKGGVSDETARKLATELDGSEASGHEQWRMVYDAAGKEGEKAVTSVMTDDMKRNWDLAKGVGVSMDDYIKVREGFKDLNGNGKQTQDEWNATLDSYTFSTNEAKDKSIKGTLWQILTGSGSTKNNPYDKEAGQKVIDAKAKGGSGSGSYAPARIPTLRIPAVPTVSKPSSGLRIRAATPAAQAPRSGLRIKAQ